VGSGKRRHFINFIWIEDPEVRGQLRQKIEPQICDSQEADKSFAINFIFEYEILAY